jgi:hypothetical protein
MREASSGVRLKIALFGELSLEEDMDLSRDRQILELIALNATALCSSSCVVAASTELTTCVSQHALFRHTQTLYSTSKLTVRLK